MQKQLGKFEPQFYALLRIVTGFMFTCHGLQKVFGMFGGPPADAPKGLMYFAGIYELVGGLMIMVGFKASLAGFLCSGLMAGAYFLAHQKDGALPITNHGELAAVYSWLFLYVAAKGSGIWSMDARSNAPAADA